MFNRLTGRALFAAALLTATFTGAAGAQAPANSPAGGPPYAEAVSTCLGVARRDPAQAAMAGRRAESLLEARLARQPRDVEALIALARTLSQCILPSAEMMEQGELSARAIELLSTALEVDPTHWTARFVLANINFRSPAFLGRAPRAAKDLDVLLGMQGDRADNPQFARVFELRGVLFQRAGSADSARLVWERGARIFPSDTTLAGLAARAAEQKPPTAPPAAAAALATVRVVASSAPAPAQAWGQRVDRSRIVMTAGGSADVMQAVQMLPGATRVGEGSDIYSRGGDATETALLIDGGRVASVSRFEGLSGGMFGAIEPFVVRSVRYSSGGFSVRHGNALSGVVEIETDGRPRERQLRAGVSLVQASGTARVPMGRTVGGWVSARVSQTGALLATHGRSSEFIGAPHSQEAIASVISNPSGTTELRATALVAQDDARQIVDAAGWAGPFHSAGGMRAVLLSSRWIAPSAPVTVRTNIVGTTQRSALDFGILDRTRDDRSLRSRADIEWAPTDVITIRGGAEHGAFTRRESGVFPVTGSVAPGGATQSLDLASSANQAGAYTEAQLTRDATSITIGLRADQLPGESSVTTDPRVAIVTQRGAWIARAGMGFFHQGRWRAQPVVPSAGTPSGVARVARHVVVGLEREGATSALSVEAYDKAYDDYAMFGTGPSIIAGWARGVDVIARRKGGGRVTGFVGYSLLDAAHRLADGQEARSSFDITHSVTASASTAFGPDWSLGSTLRFGTGAPHTPIVGGRTDIGASVLPVYGALMSERLPTYARADLRVMRFVRTPAFLLSTFVEVINVTNRHNVSTLTYAADYQSRRPVHSFFATRTVVAGGEFQLR